MIIITISTKDKSLPKPVDVLPFVALSLTRVSFCLHVNSILIRPPRYAAVNLSPTLRQFWIELLLAVFVVSITSMIIISVFMQC